MEEEKLAFGIELQVFEVGFVKVRLKLVHKRAGLFAIKLVNAYRIYGLLFVYNIKKLLRLIEEFRFGGAREGEADQLFAL